MACSDVRGLPRSVCSHGELSTLTVLKDLFKFLDIQVRHTHIIYI